MFKNLLMSAVILSLGGVAFAQNKFIPKKDYYAELVRITASNTLEKDLVSKSEVKGLATLDGYAFKDEKALELYKKQKSNLKEVLTESEAKELFTFLAGQSQIPFKKLSDGHYVSAVRDYEMARLLVLKGIKSQRVLLSNVWFYPKDVKLPSSDTLWASAVAPVIKVDYKNQIVNLVLDPTHLKLPVTVKDWLDSFEVVGDPQLSQEPRITIQDRSDRVVTDYSDIYDAEKAKNNLEQSMRYLLPAEY